MIIVLELVSGHSAAAMVLGQHLPSTAVLPTGVLVVVGTSVPWPQKLAMPMWSCVASQWSEWVGRLVCGLSHGS